jgi:hypothetical protein
MLEILQDTFPGWIKKWIKNELSLHPLFKNLRILVTLDGFFPTITTILQTSSGHSVVSHGSGNTLKSAYEGAMAETCRLATNIDHQHFFQSSKNLLSNMHFGKVNPEDHVMAYAYHEPLPEWLFGDKVAWANIAEIWNKIAREKSKNLTFEFYEVAQAPLFVGYAKSPDVQSLFFGQTRLALDKGKINFNRLNLCGGAQELNLEPHFIS